MTWSDGRGRATGNDPFVVFPLRARHFVYAVRVRYAHPEASADDSADLELFWRDGGEDYIAGIRNARKSAPAAPDGGVVMIEVVGTLDEIRLDADPRRGLLPVDAIDLLVAR